MRNLFRVGIFKNIYKNFFDDGFFLVFQVRAGK